MKQVAVGILGYGTVAQGVIEVLTSNAQEIERRCGYKIHIKSVARRSWEGTDTTALPFACVSSEEIVTDRDIDVVLELIGGMHPAYELIEAALKHHKHVITANKALIAEHGEALFRLARENGLDLSYEAAVAGGIPVIKVLREGMSGNEISVVAGIINGTGNFILTEMREKGRSFQDALQEAQALGYAEADPSFDINGTDAAHKITILASIAFGIPLQFDAVHIEGIDSLTPEDIENADALGYAIKHLGLAIRREHGVEIRVHPTLIPKKALLASVSGVMNAVQVRGNAIGNSLYYGPGAGKLPTASAVVADLIDCVRELNLKREDRLSEFGFNRMLDKEALPVLPSAAYHSRYYVRMLVTNRIGVLAEITRILAEQGISIDSLVQKNEQTQNNGNAVPLIFLTDHVQEAALDAAIETLESLATILAPIVRIRVEDLR